MRKLYLLMLLLMVAMPGCRQTAKQEPETKVPEREEPTREEPADTLEPGMAEIPAEPEAVNKPRDTVYTRYGRTAILENGSTELISPASAVRFRARGDTVIIHLETQREDHGYALVTLNDNFSWKYRLPGTGISEIPIPLGSGDPWHEIAVYKLTEAHNGGVIFHKATADGLSRTAYAPEINIEFIGNSITCGYGADATGIPCGEGVSFDQHNAYQAYAASVARELRAGYNLSAVSGIGVYRNYRPDQTVAMPGIYRNLYLDDGRGGNWTPADWNPDIVSICLGTNDLSDGPQNSNKPAFDSEKFTSAYISFIQELDVLYPNAAFAILNSPMVKGEKAEVLNKALEQVRAHFADKEIIELFKFEGIANVGCAGHPELKEHEMMADQVRPFYINLLDKVAERDGLLVE